MLIFDTFKKSIDFIITKSKYFFIGLISLFITYLLLSGIVTFYKTTSPLLYKDRNHLVTVKQLTDKSINNYDETIDNVYWGKISYGEFINISGAKRDERWPDKLQGYIVITQKYLNFNKEKMINKINFFYLQKNNIKIVHSLKSYDNKTGFKDFLKFNKKITLENALLFPTRIKIIYHEILFSITKTFNY